MVYIIVYNIMAYLIKEEQSTNNITMAMREKRRKRQSVTQQQRCRWSVIATVPLVLCCYILPILNYTPITTVAAAEISDELLEAFNTVTQETATPIELDNLTFTSLQGNEEVEISAGTVYSTCPDLDYITGPMHDADADNNGFLNQDEYLEFTNSISGGYLTQMGWDEDFTDMPLSLQETYLVLSCLCELYPKQPWGGKGCCTTNRPGEFNTGIRTDGTAPGQTPNEDELQYLTYVCGTMSESLENVGAEIVIPPTASPTTRPTDKPSVKPVTSPPVDTPTPKPTMRPTTLKPTPKPTSEPSKSPSNKPTQQPSSAPTMEPTDKPSRKPVAPGSPTESPIITESPTKKPSKSPVTSSPTSKPVVSPPSPKPVVPGSPTVSPTKLTVPTKDPTPSPSTSPTSSSEPTMSLAPSNPPTTSSQPTSSAAPSDPPTVSSRPTSSSAPTGVTFTGYIPASVDFVVSLSGLVSADEIMEGKTNQVKIMLEEQMLVLSDIVIMEEFGNGTEVGSGRRLNNLRGKVVRHLIVKAAVLATLDDVQDADCPDTSTNPGVQTLTDCLNFNNTIILHMVDQLDVEGTVEIFENAMLDKIAEGWLVDNFDIEEALKPPPSPTPPPFNKVETDDDVVDSKSLSIGAIIGIVVSALAVLILTLLFADKYRRRNKGTENDDEDFALERRQSLKDSELAKEDGLAPAEAFATTEVVDDSMSTDNKSFSSQDHLLQGQAISSSTTASALPSTAPTLGEMKEEEGGEEMEESFDSEMIESIHSDLEDAENTDRDRRSPLAAMAAASTLVASTSTTTPRASTSTLDNIMQSYSPAEFGSDSQSNSTSDLPQESRAIGGGGSGSGGVVAEGGKGIGAGAAAAIGAVGTGVIAAGAYAATRSRSKSPEKMTEDDEKEEQLLEDESTSTPDVSDAQSSSEQPDSSTADVSGISSPETPDNSSASLPNAMDDIDAAIEAGNWGQVGALAAVLASQGYGGPSKKMSVRSGSSAISGGRSSADESGTSSQSLDLARAIEIDKLVEAGDWQGVVLAAARFEADQTFDGESFSASASQSSRWTGSATSATTPRSMATSADQSASNISSQRGQEEIRAEVEALVRRVVPEEADNIDEMMTQFKGREEELVETLRRMQERAIASRARLAVQKSAKLEARAKASPRSASASPSGQSVGSAGSTKSELEQAIESGNWQAVGEAAQKMSDSSVGELSVEEKARLRDAVSHSPFRSSPVGKKSEEDDNLDLLIEQGDWQGVIAAAKKASEEGPEHDVSMDESDAIAQANMWQEIANQSKQEARGGPAGADDAAAWAISRSLNAMNSPEEGKAARTINDIVDEQSSDASQYESSSYGGSM